MEQMTFFFCRQDGAPSLSDNIRLSVTWSVYICAFKDMLCSIHEGGVLLVNDMTLIIEKMNDKIQV